MEVLRPTDITPQKGRRPSLAKRILLRAKSTSQTGIQLPSPNATPYPELHLLSLPGEIRNHIYSFLFHPEDEREWLERSQIDPHFNHGLNFLRTCRMAYHETHEMAWAGFTPLISPYEHQYKFSIPDKPSRVSTLGKSKNANLPQHSISRVTVQQYLFWAVYPWWLLEKQGNLRPKEVLFQYCLCTKLDELDKDPGKVRSVLDSFDSAARGVKSLERIIVYSCGNLTSVYSRQFSECFKGAESLALQVQDRYILRPIAEESTSRSLSEVDNMDSDDEPQEVPVPDEDELWKTSRTFHLIRRREVEGAQPVIVEFITSLDVCGFGCTRDRAKAVAAYRDVRQDSVTRQSTLSDALRSFSIGGLRKDSIAQSKVQH